MKYKLNKELMVIENTRVRLYNVDIYTIGKVDFIMKRIVAILLFIAIGFSLLQVIGAVSPEYAVAAGRGQIIPKDTSLEVMFPDENFRNYVVEEVFERNKANKYCDASGHITALGLERLYSCTVVECEERKISSLEGIEYFTNVLELLCYGNKITKLDVSNNTKLEYLDCSDNQITEINTGYNSRLIELYCENNKLSELDINGNGKLEVAYCSKNALTTLKIDKCTNLTELYCDFNELTKLDIGNNTSLKYLYCNDNKLTALNMGKHYELVDVACENNQIEQLDLGKAGKLEFFSCDKNKLKELDISKNPHLVYLSCADNEIANLDVKRNDELTDLYCENNKIAELDLSENEWLIVLSCGNNQLTSLDVRKSEELLELYCDSNLITTLDLNGNPELEILECSYNQLEILNITKATALLELSCKNNKLTTLDVSKLHRVEKIYCENNQITGLELDKNYELINLNCKNNQIKTLDISKNANLKTLACNGNPLEYLNVGVNNKNIKMDVKSDNYKAKIENSVESDTDAKTETVDSGEKVQEDIAFVDIKNTDYCYDAVTWAAKNNITQGVDDKHFGATNVTTRAQMVTFLWRGAGMPEPAAKTHAFKDVEAGSYYEKAVLWAVEKGITKGINDTTFGPNINVNRGQTVTFLARMAGITDEAKGYSHSFSDVDGTSYYNNAVAWAAENGITTGISDTTFNPKNDCLRGQIVTFLHRYFVKAS